MLSEMNAGAAKVMTVPSPAVYVVGQDQTLRQRLCTVLRSLPWPVNGYDCTSELITVVTAGCIVAVDDGLDLIVLMRSLRRYEDRVRLILLTTDSTVSSAVAALRHGVHDLIELPVVERDLHRRVSRAMDTIDLG